VIRVGVIGAGAAALTAHLPALTALDQFEVVGLCDTSPARLAAVLGRFPVPGFAEPDALLGLPDLDAVVIATPPQTHATLAAKAMERRKHVLCEKPLAPTVQECRRLLEMSAQTGTVLAVGHEKRFHPSLRRVRDLLAAGSLGTPFYAGVHWGAAAKLEPERLIPPGFRHGYEWRWRDPAVGGGLLQDHLPHYVDLLRFWTAQEPVGVLAYTANVARDFLGWAPEHSVWEDFCLAVVRYSAGLVLRFETSVVGRSISPIWSLGSGMGEWTEYGYLLCSDGQLVFDLLPWDSSENGRIAVNRKGGEGWLYVEQPEPVRRDGGAASEMFQGQALAWAGAIEGEPSSVARGEDGLICIAAVEAAYRAADTSAEVSLST
jgi:predicted dehydrogenase